MGADKQVSGDLSVFTVGGSSQLAVLENVTYRTTVAKNEGRILKVVGGQAQAGRRSGRIEMTNMSTISGSAPTRVTAFELSAISLGGVDVIALINTLDFSGNMNLKDAAAAPEEWAWPQFMGKDYSARATLFIPATSGQAFSAAVHGARSGLAVTLTFTINGVAITLPMLITEAVHKTNVDDHQMYEVALEGRAPDSGSYPTAPTGTTSLLEKAFAAPGTALAFVITTKASPDGVTYSGNMVYESFNFSIGQNGQLVKEQYTWAVRGTPTAATS